MTYISAKTFIILLPVMFGNFAHNMSGEVLFRYFTAMDDSAKRGG